LHVVQVCVLQVDARLVDPSGFVPFQSK
jgi:hypothetical protein